MSVRGGGGFFVCSSKNPTVVVDWQGAPAQDTATGSPKIRAHFFAPKPAPVGVAVAPGPSAVVVGGSAVEAGHDGLGQDFSTSDGPARDDAGRGRNLLL